MEDENDDKDDTKRKSRNLSEKKRRDQFNLLVNDLSSLISSTSRKMDKSTILKSTIAFLKHHNDVTDKSKIHEIHQDWKPSFLTNDEFTQLMLEALDGFILIFSSNGSIHHVSENVTSLLGYLPSDLLNMTIFDLAYEVDHEKLYNIFLNPLIDPLKTETSTDTQINAFVHLKRGTLDKVDTPAYELVKLVGYLRNDANLDNLRLNTQSRSYSKDSCDKMVTFIGTARVQMPQLMREVSAIDPSKDEFTSRHSMEWKFLFLDHRAPPIIGYMPFEVLGTSGYDYYHFDDLHSIITCHEELMQKGEGKSCFYRFLTKGQQWIWLQSDYYISYHQLSSKPDYVVCTHRVVSYAEIIRHNKMQANSKHNRINAKSPSATVTLKDLSCSAPVPVSGASNGANLNFDEIGKQLTTTARSKSPELDSGTVWSSRTPKISNYSHMNSMSDQSSAKRKRYMHTRTIESDFTSDSGSSRHSVTTHLSAPSRTRHMLSSQLPHVQQQHSQQQQQSTSLALHQQQAHLQQTHQHQEQMQSQSNKILPTKIPQQAIGLQLVSSATAQFAQPSYPIRNPQLVAQPFLEPQQYLTAIPVQPVISPFPMTPVLPPMTNASDILPGAVVMTPTQTQIQDQLQRKHDELQKLIIQQQDELRRVSEQLLMARYTFLQPVAYNNNHNNNNRHYHVGNSTMNQPQPQSQQQQQFVNYNFGLGQNEQLHNNHHDSLLQQHQPQNQQHQMYARNINVPELEQFGHEEIDAFLNAEVLQPSLPPPPTMIPNQQQQPQQQQPQHQQQHQEQTVMSLNQHNLATQQDDSLLSYIQMQPESTSNLNFQMGIIENGSENRSETMGRQNSFNPYQAPSNQLPNDLEILPYQMLQEQSQILFNSPHTPGQSQ